MYATIECINPTHASRVIFCQIHSLARGPKTKSATAVATLRSDCTLPLILYRTITDAPRSACSLWGQPPLQPRPHPELPVEQRPDVAAAPRKPLEDRQHHLPTAQASGLCSEIFSHQTCTTTYNKPGRKAHCEEVVVRRAPSERANGQTVRWLHQKGKRGVVDQHGACKVAS